jgi:EmrB/QacA subfamily drug resistance transporter
MSTDENAAPPGDQAPGRLDAEVWRVVTVVILGSIMAVLDTTIVNVALHDLSEDLHASLGNIQWVVSGYLLSLAAVIPMTGWAGRRYGRKRVYLVALVVFTFGSALCGLATSTTELIVFRVIQGVGGGMIMPIGQMIMVRASGPRNLARVMSAFSVPVLLAPVMGPTIGGLLLDNVGWRWIFYVNVPIGVVAVILGLRQLPSDPPEDAGRFDLLGLVLIATGLVGLTYGLAEVGTTDGAITHVVVPLVGGIGLVAAFIGRSLRLPQPLLDMRLYANKVFAAASISTFGFGAVLFGSSILLPLYFQTVRFEDPVYTGLLLAPRGVGAAIASYVAGRITDRIGSGVTAAIGGVTTMVFTIPFVLLSDHTPYLLTSIIMVFQGFGFGMAFTSTMTAAFRALRPDQINDASPQLNILMRVGGSIGTALLTVILEHYLTRAGPSVSGQASAFSTTFVWVLGIAAAAAVPSVVLMITQRRQARTAATTDEAAGDAAPSLIEAE